MCPRRNLVIQTLFSGLLLTSGLSQRAVAQYVPPSPVPALLGPGATPPSQFESIDPINGNLTLNLPLAKLAPGRGGLSGGVNLIYNSAFYMTEVIPGISSGQVQIDYTSGLAVTGANSVWWNSGG